MTITQNDGTTLTLDAATAGAATRMGTLTLGGNQVSVRQNGRRSPTFDINHDGAADILAYDPAGGLHAFAYANPRNLGFTNGHTAPWSPGWSVFPCDFNGEGRAGCSSTTQ